MITPRSSIRFSVFLGRLLSGWLLLCTTPSPGALAPPSLTSAGFDAEGRFAVVAAVPEGAHHAVMDRLASAAPPVWETMLATAIDGRAATVTFRLPRAVAPAEAVVRVRVGAAAEIPSAVLDDPALVSVEYRSSGSVPLQAKFDFLEAAGPMMKEWESLPRAMRHERLTTWARQSPWVADAGAGTDANTVWVEFLDGDIAVLLDPRRTEQAIVSQGVRARSGAVEALAWTGADARTGIAGLTETGDPRVASATVDPPVGLPGSTSAITAFSLEPGFPNSAPTIAGWLQANGYQPADFATTTAAQIKDWDAAGPIGVLFWHAHGVDFKKKDGTTTVGLVTGEPVTEELETGAYAAMRAAGELFLAKDGDKPPVYFVTGRFVKNHLRFAPHSFVMVDACYGGNNDLAQCFLEAGAGAYVSWDWESGPESGTPCLQIFDRLLGTNAEPPISDPGERSFSLPAVRTWMHLSGYDIDPSAKYPNQQRPNARLAWRLHPAAPAHILKPSIMRVLTQFSGHNGTFTALLLEGDFGADPGPSQRSVLWAGNPVPVLSWDQNGGIVIRPPTPPPSGSFQVVIRNRFASNEVPMSCWTVPFAYRFNGRGSLTYSVDLDVTFLSDVHGYRGMPEQPVSYVPMPFGSLSGSKGNVSASGSYSPDPGTTIAWSGGGRLTSIDTQRVTGVEMDSYSFQGVAHPGMNRIDAFVLTSTGRFTETVNDESTQCLAPVLGLSWPPPTFHLVPQTSAMLGGKLTFDFGSQGSASLSWPTVVPGAAPNDLTVR